MAHTGQGPTGSPSPRPPCAHVIRAHPVGALPASPVPHAPCTAARPGALPAPQLPVPRSALTRTQPRISPATHGMVDSWREQVEENASCVMNERVTGGPPGPVFWRRHQRCEQMSCPARAEPGPRPDPPEAASPASRPIERRAPRGRGCRLPTAMVVQSPGWFSHVLGKVCPVSHRLLLEFLQRDDRQDATGQDRPESDQAKGARCVAWVSASALPLTSREANRLALYLLRQVCFTGS